MVRLGTVGAETMRNRQRGRTMRLGAECECERISLWLGLISTLVTVPSTTPPRRFTSFSFVLIWIYSPLTYSSSSSSSTSGEQLVHTLCLSSLFPSAPTLRVLSSWHFNCEEVQARRLDDVKRQSFFSHPGRLNVSYVELSTWIIGSFLKPFFNTESLRSFETTRRLNASVSDFIQVKYEIFGKF